MGDNYKSTKWCKWQLCDTPLERNMNNHDVNGHQEKMGSNTKGILCLKSPHFNQDSFPEINLLFVNAVFPDALSVLLIQSSSQNQSLGMKGRCKMPP